MFEVSVHFYGRKRIISDCPAQGLLDWPAHKWTRITARPVGLAKAKTIADEQLIHAAVTPWNCAGVIYENGKVPGVPIGWVSVED